MKIIFSRKGTDSVFGRIPSPIVEGRPLSLPIPEGLGDFPLRYLDLPQPIPELLQDLAGNKLQVDSRCHLDPDLARGTLQRSDGWRGVLGQCSTSQSHLEYQGVGSGDLFLFYGWFRSVRKTAGRWRYIGEHEHRIWGWLQVDRVEHIGSDPREFHRRCPEFAYHPHAFPGYPPNSSLYIGRERLSLDGDEVENEGFGTFERGYRLTAEQQQRSIWHVPDWLHPGRGGVGMTGQSESGWLEGNLLRTKSPGQEYVAQISQADIAAFHWLRQLFQNG